MKTTIELKVLTDYIVKHKDTEEYQSDNDVSQCFGWDGDTMSPITRKAIIKKYGIEIVEVAEKLAMIETVRKEKSWELTNYFKHCKEADNNAIPVLGSYVWAYSSNLKCDGGNGIFDEISNQLWLEKEDYGERDKDKLRLCYIENLVEVDDADMDKISLAEDIVAKYKPTCGWKDDDNWEDYKTCYTIGCAVVSDRRWFIIDTEKYDYCRYIYTPTNAKEMFPKAVELHELKENIRKTELHKSKCEELVEYIERKQVYEPFMTDLTPLIEEYRNAKYGTKEYTSLKQRLTNARKKNIEAMVKFHHPDLKFKVLVGDSYYCYSFKVEWEDQLINIEDVDLGLFCNRHYHMEMDDSVVAQKAKNISFAEKYMGTDISGEIKRERKVSQKTSQDIKKLIESCTGRCYDSRHDLTDEEIQKIADKSIVDFDTIKNYTGCSWTDEQSAYWAIFSNTTYK